MLTLHYKRQAGVGLIEVLVTLLILATSLLAMGALQSRSLQFNHSAYLRSQANVMAYDILDRIRINRDELASYGRDYDDDVPTGGSVADTDMAQWLGRVQTVLPGGDAEIECDDDRVCTVSLRWVEQDEVPGGTEVQETATFSYTTRL